MKNPKKSIYYKALYNCMLDDPLFLMDFTKKHPVPTAKDFLSFIDNVITAYIHDYNIFYDTAYIDCSYLIYNNKILNIDDLYDLFSSMLDEL